MGLHIRYTSSPSLLTSGPPIIVHVGSGSLKTPTGRASSRVGSRPDPALVGRRRREAFTKEHYCRLIMHVLCSLASLALPIKAKKMIRFLYGISNYFLAIEVDPSSSSLDLWK